MSTQSGERMPDAGSVSVAAPSPLASAFSSLVPHDRIEIREGYADVGDLRLHYVEAGEGPLVVLLHGFPEFWFAWRLQIEPLAAAGFRVVAPDTRGYNRSSKPEGFETYLAAALPTTAIRTATSTMREFLSEDHDVLMLVNPALDGIRDPDISGSANLHPRDWVKPFP